MKSLLISLILFAVMLSSIAVNAIYINNVANKMNDLLAELPDIGEEGCSDATRDICDYWEKNTPYVGLSVGYTIVDRVSEQAATLSACAACNDFFGFRTALALLRDAVGDMRRLEKFSIENLL